MTENGTQRSPDFIELSCSEKVIQWKVLHKWVVIIPVSYTHLTLPTSDLV